uniref:SprT-like domain-containing protein n=1 Tax=Ciona savignyi TaxID=51511 RepID=H2YD66_CIOSA
MTESDYELALSLQRQYDNAAEIVPNVNIQPSSSTPDSIVDPRWELIDPNPNIHALFQQFNKLYFWRALDMVEVRWSARMTLCAGICSYQGRGGLCSIGLSQPLLKLRPRKDLIETLLIYHSFHDEVDELRQHWWRCRGACQRRPPYFGFVKRSMNRAPSKNDTWWAEHQRTCGGSYDKVKEPENYGKKK